MSDIGKLQRPEAKSIDPAELAHDAPGATLDDPATARERAGGELKYRASGGAGGVAPMQRLMDERRAIGGQLAARVQRKADGASGSVSIPEGGGTKLSETVRARMEPKLGADLSDVRVHTGGESAQAASGFGARAFTVGSDVHFNAGEFAPGSKEGDRLIAHELTHVVQGKNSGVQRKSAENPDSNAAGAGHDAAHPAAAASANAGGPANENEVSHPDEPAEKEADAVADGVTDSLHGGGDKKAAGAKDKDKKDGKVGAHGMGAEAFTAGADVHLGGGAAGHAAPAHEAAHVAQQGGGSVAAGGATSSAAPAEKRAQISAKYVGVGRKIFRRPGTPQTGEIAKNNPQAQDPSVAPPSLDNPLLHPYYNTFKTRVIALAATTHVSISDPAAFAESTWMKICNGVKAAAPSMKDKDAYSDFVKGWLNLSSNQFKTAISQFETVSNELAKIGTSQFNKANSFGFWSKDEGRALAESMSDLTLETSSVGTLMDGLPTLEGKKAGWDPEIWGALSKAYATAVGPQLVKGKKLNVCVGAGAQAGNIWDAVESKVLEKGLGQFDMTLESVANYYGAAAKTKKDRKTLDASKNVGGVPGCVYAGKDRAAAAAAAETHYNKLPEK